VVHFAPVSISRAARRFARHLPALALFALFAVASTWPLATRMDDTLVSWGDPVFQTWTLAWDWHALRDDPRDIFDANVFYPWRNTLAYSDHLFGQAIMVLPALALDEPILADNLAVLLSLILSALAMYLLTLDLTNNRGAAILAGIAYAYAPARLAHLEHLHLLSAMWPPLVLLWFRGWGRTPRPHGLRFRTGVVRRVFLLLHAGHAADRRCGRGRVRRAGPRPARGYPAGRGGRGLRAGRVVAAAGVAALPASTRRPGHRAHIGRGALLAGQLA
jgi:hypothetical protein